MRLRVLAANPPEVFMDNPKVSICIPTYCRPALLRRALASALAQDFGPMEIIISDNASQDGSWGETEKLGSLDPRIIIRRNEKNLGWTGNVNACIGAARGKYLVFLCDDDELLPGMIKASYEFMEAHPDAGLVHVPAYYVGLAGKAKPVVPVIEPYINAGIEALSHTAFEFNMVFSATMARAECFAKLGGFVESISSDYEMWTRIAAKYGVGYIPKPLLRVYVHAISPKMTPDRYITESERLMKLVLAHFPENLRKSPDLLRKGKEQMAAAMRSLGIQALQAGYWQSGFGFFRSAKEYSRDYGFIDYASDVLLKALPRRMYFLLKRKKLTSTHV